MGEIFSKNDIITSIIIIFINVEKKYIQSKIIFKNIHYTHPLAYIAPIFNLRARPLYILSFSKCKSQKSIHTAFCSRICTYNYRDSSYFFYYHRKIQPLVTNLLRKIFFFVYIDKSIDIAQFFALIKTIQYNNFCYESLITYYLYNFKVISEDSIYFGLIRLDFKIIL